MDRFTALTRIYPHLVAVHRDGRHGEGGHEHGDGLREGDEGAHEASEWPVVKHQANLIIGNEYHHNVPFCASLLTTMLLQQT